MVMSGWSVNLATLFLGRLRPPKQFTSALCTYFHQQLTTALLESAEEETKVCGQTGYWETKSHSIVIFFADYLQKPEVFNFLVGMELLSLTGVQKVHICKS